MYQLKELYQYRVLSTVYCIDYWFWVIPRDLYHCKPVILQGDESEIERKHYIELTLKAEWPEGHIIPRPSDLAYKRPKVRCDSQEIAHKVRHCDKLERFMHVPIAKPE